MSEDEDEDSDGNEGEDVEGAEKGEENEAEHADGGDQGEDSDGDGDAREEEIIGYARRKYTTAADAQPLFAELTALPLGSHAFRYLCERPGTATERRGAPHDAGPSTTGRAKGAKRHE